MTETSDPGNASKLEDSERAAEFPLADTAGREPSLVSHVRASHGPGLTESIARLVEPFGGWTAYTTVVGLSPVVTYVAMNG